MQCPVARKNYNNLIIFHSDTHERNKLPSMKTNIAKRLQGDHLKPVTYHRQSHLPAIIRAEAFRCQWMAVAHHPDVRPMLIARASATVFC